ncbi:hypothetical protein [Janthinobacterium agaricidamnosum]|uniref:Lipoprotein n=1 Tax=Janthinobacterium agaricidamnosum NBRC 102515 = DSM 9628 TaxID=1349767 RepID=W0VB13_9BURK|nr:hypothetical protein [Janthinobacterium agaricidamnosum]CDG85071.1 putative uncharacterized protein [Janthinobacterium agaricidamnosum NBRC 102515 = DSM 9628]
MKRILMCALAVLSCSAYAQPAFTGNNFSGTYDCAGNDNRDGAFGVTLKVALAAAQSSGDRGAYTLTMEVPDYASYKGSAIAKGKQVAVSFANLDTSGKDYGTSVGTMSKNKANKWVFTSYYYQPEYKGGGFGTETCTQQ